MSEYSHLYNLNSLKKTVSDDTNFLVLMLDIFIETNTESLIKLFDALQSKNWKVAGEISHKMLSSFRHLEINEAIADLMWLERLIWEVQLEEEIFVRYNRIKTLSQQVFNGLTEDIKLIKST